MKGYVKGSLWGLILGGVGLSGISLANKQPDFATGPAEPQLASPELVPAVTTTQLPVPLPSSPEDVPSFVDSVPLSVATPDSETPPEVSTETAELPVVAAVEEPAPQATTTATVPFLAEDAVEALDVAPPVTAGQDDIPVAVAPPVIVVEDQAEAVAADAETTAPAAEPAPEPQEAAPTADDTPQSEVAEVPQDTPMEVTAADEPVSEAAIETVQPPVAAETVVATPEETPVPAQENTAPLQETAVPEQAPAASDQSVVVAQALPQASGGVRINRPGAEPAEAEDAAPATAETDEIAADAPALMRFAAPFENGNGLPKIAVVLVDTDAMADAAPALTTLGFAPTVAINALADGAGEKMAAYRAAGLEVALQADLPSGARPADVEVAFEAAFQLLPEAAMLFSLGAGAIQDRSVNTQVMQILAADGLGFVTVQRGLSDATRAAEQAGVPAATILRDLDGADEDSGAIARALDQAAFRARQTSDVVIMGRMTPDTLTALRDWAAGLDQSTLAIAPVSAILLSQDE